MPPLWSVKLCIPADAFSAKTQTHHPQEEAANLLQRTSNIGYSHIQSQTFHLLVQPALGIRFPNRNQAVPSSSASKGLSR